MDLDKVSKLADWGFNVPFFVRYISTSETKINYQWLKVFFKEISRFCIFAEKKGKKKFIKDISLQDAFLQWSLFIHEGFDVALMEYIRFKEQKIVYLCADGSGTFSNQWFSHYELLKRVKSRIILRRLFPLVAKLEAEKIKVDFVWADDFSGVYSDRLIIFDYEKIV